MEKSGKTGNMNTHLSRLTQNANRYIVLDRLLAFNEMLLIDPPLGNKIFGIKNPDH